MKTLLTLLCLLPFVLLAQSNEPFKKASTIEIHTSMSASEAYKAIAMSLQDNGFIIASSDATLQTISTDGKVDKNITSKLSTSVRGDSVSIIILKGTFELSNLGASPIMYRGMGGSPSMRAWEQMEAVARALPFTSILYR
jgi:hypothetical protein